MSDFLDSWGLTLAIFLPLVGVAIMLLIPRKDEEAHKLVALVTSLATAGVGVALLANFDYDRTGILQFQVDRSWIPLIDSRYHVALDGLSLPLLALTLLVVPLCVIYSWKHFPEPHNPKAFLILILILETGMVGTFCAQDLILFFVFFEVVLLPMYFMIGVWGGPNRQYASIKFFLYTLLGSALMLVSFLALYFLLGTFQIPELAELAGSGLARTTGLLAVIGIIYGALCCLAQTDMKRLIAFSSVAHMGFVMLGIATLTDFGFNAAIFGMVAHGLITGMLFFIAGSTKDRFHTLEIKRLGGLLIQAPHMAWLLGLSVMASLGLPGLAGFWGEFPAILSAYQPGADLDVTVFRVYMVIAALGTVLAAGYLLWLYQRVAFGEPKEEWAGHEIPDATPYELVAWAPMIILMIVLGFYPNLLFDITDGAVVRALSAFGS